MANAGLPAPLQFKRFERQGFASALQDMLWIINRRFRYRRPDSAARFDEACAGMVNG